MQVDSIHVFVMSPMINLWYFRLRDEEAVCELITKLQGYLEVNGSRPEICRVYLRHIEHLYYKVCVGLLCTWWSNRRDGWESIWLTTLPLFLITRSQIFAHLAKPYLVNSHFIIWPQSAPPLSSFLLLPFFFCNKNVIVTQLLLCDFYVVAIWSVTVWIFSNIEPIYKFFVLWTVVVVSHIVMDNVNLFTVTPTNSAFQYQYNIKQKWVENI